MSRGWAVLVLAAIACPAAAQDGLDVSFGYEHRVDRPAYRFENPSTLEAGELVPHFFRQQYPDRDLRFWARALAAGTTLSVERATGPFLLEFLAGYARTFSVGSSARFDRHSAQATARIGWRRTGPRKEATKTPATKVTK